MLVVHNGHPVNILTHALLGKCLNEASRRDIYTVLFLTMPTLLNECRLRARVHHQTLGRRRKTSARE